MKKLSAFIGIAVLATFFIVGHAQAADQIVDADGMADFGPPIDCDGLNTTNVESTVQDGIDAASASDRVLVCPGTYTEVLSITTDNLTLEGGGRRHGHQHHQGRKRAY